MQKRHWGDEFLNEALKRELELVENEEEAAEDRWDEEGPLSAFEDAADHAYDEEILKAEEKENADWFEE
jgi:hypothetical protein